MHCSCVCTAQCEAKDWSVCVHKHLQSAVSLHCQRVCHSYCSTCLYTGSQLAQDEGIAWGLSGLCGTDSWRTYSSLLGKFYFFDHRTKYMISLLVHCLTQNGQNSQSSSVYRIPIHLPRLILLLIELLGLEIRLTLSMQLKGQLALLY